jgi:SET domain-containing protein
MGFIIDDTFFKVKLSKINGRGVFTTVPIKKNTLVWKFDDKCIIVKNPAKTKLWRFKNFAWYSNKYQSWIYDNDKSKWINHSNNPNLISITENELYATRNIGVNEELTQDYCNDYKECNLLNQEKYINNFYKNICL